MPPVIICLINQKGGCGKSSTCFHLAGHFAQVGPPRAAGRCRSAGFAQPGLLRVQPCRVPGATGNLGGLVPAMRHSRREALCARTPLENITIVRSNQHLAAHNTPCPEATGLRQFALQSCLTRAG